MDETTFPADDTDAARDAVARTEPTAVADEPADSGDTDEWLPL